MKVHITYIDIAPIAGAKEYRKTSIKKSTYAITTNNTGKVMHKKKPMLKKVLKHLKEDVKDEKKEIKEDVQLGKSLKKAGACKK